MTDAIGSLDADNTQPFFYDPNGNLTTDSFAGTQNTWNFRNELKTSVRGGASATYGYDSAGLRVSETVNGVTTAFPTPDFSSAGATTTISFSAAGMPIATIEKTLTGAPQMYALHTDHLSSTRLATNQGGKIVGDFGETFDSTHG